MISHQDLVYLDSNPFMKNAKVLNSITLNGTLHWNFPVRDLTALFCYLFNSYVHSFLTVFFIYQLVLNIFQPFCFLVMPFPDAPKITLKSFTFFSIWYINWSYPISIEFCVHLLLMKIEDSILSKLFSFLMIFLTLALFASILCFSSSITVFKLFLFTLYLLLNSLNLHFFFNPSSPRSPNSPLLLVLLLLLLVLLLLLATSFLLA